MSLWPAFPQPHFRSAWALVFLAGCTEYGLEKEIDEPPGAVPEIIVEPEVVAAHACEAPWTGAVVVRNDGEGPLTVTGIATTGDWSASLAVPVTVLPGEGTPITLTGDGEGTLTVYSDDPDEPAVVVPLNATLNHPPTATILSPADGSILPEPAVDQTLDGLVTDEDGDDLLVTWTVDGAVLSSTTTAPGAVSATWSAPDSGAHTLQLTAADACGEVKANAEVCQQGTTTYENLGISTWHYEGSAYWDSTASELVLTDALTEQVGTAFDTTAAVSGGAVSIEFEFYIGSGTGADGISLTALDADRLSSYTGGTGCGIGYGGNASCTSGPALPGWSIEVDTYYNEGYDPTANDHVAFTFDGDADNPAAWAALPEIEDTGWHRMRVVLTDPHVSVTIDGVSYIEQDLFGYFAFPAYVGFTAGTGGYTNSHRVRSLTVTDQACGVS
jgi:hypothetical protein